MESALYLVSTPIGNRADITDRAGQTLREVDVVYAEDTRRTGRLLGWIGSEAPLRSLYEHNEAARVEEILGRLANRQCCAIVSDAGTPVVSDPGVRVVRAVLEAGFSVVPVPGASAVLAALAASGLSGDRFVFLGFPPRRGAERAAWIDQACGLPFTLVAFESPRRIGRLLEDLREAGLAERRCTVCRELTKLHETVRSGTVAEMAAEFAEETKGEVTLVIEGSSSRGNEAWLERREEVERSAARMGKGGSSARDIREKLGDEYGVPRNVAYALGLRFGRKGRGP